MTFSLPDDVIRSLATRGQRHRHLLWHTVRNAWCAFSDEQQRDFMTRYPGWVPPHPAMAKDGSIIIGHSAGFDFLGMHHLMIDMVNVLLRKAGALPIRAWDRPPANEEVPIQAVSGATGDELRCKATWFWSVLDQECRRLRDPALLRKLSLDALGTMIEFGVHNAMHLRFGEHPRDGVRLSDPTLSIPVHVRFDDPSYNTLLDMYSAHVHPLFWRLHGWIDDCIVHWQVAHHVDTIDWAPTWTGPMHPHGDAHGIAIVDAHAELQLVEEALKFVADAVPTGLGIAGPTFPVIDGDGQLTYQQAG
jgi:hypothetical protein